MYRPFWKKFNKCYATDLWLELEKHKSFGQIAGIVDLSSWRWTWSVFSLKSTNSQRCLASAVWLPQHVLPQRWSQHIGIWSMLTGLAFGRVKVQYILSPARSSLPFFFFADQRGLWTLWTAWLRVHKTPAHLLELTEGDKREATRERERERERGGDEEEEVMRGWNIQLSEGKEGSAKRRKGEAILLACSSAWTFARLICSS